MSTEHKITVTEKDEYGDIVKQTEHIHEQKFATPEPDHVKIYTKMYTEFFYGDVIPSKYKDLFVNLACKMSYCNSSDMENSQIVYVGGHVKEQLLKECGWKSKDPLMKGLKALCDCGAIKKTKWRGHYQINPNLAAKGSWIYNSKRGNGGIKDMIATFDFRNRVVKAVAEQCVDQGEGEQIDTYRYTMNEGEQVFENNYENDNLEINESFEERLY